MPFPTTDRLKILTEQMAQQAETAWQSHPFGPRVLPGLVVDYYMPSGSSSSGGTPQPTALRVVPVVPSAVTQAGDVSFNLTVPTDLTKVHTVRVYAVNVAGADLESAFAKGVVIPYWRLDGAGDERDTVRGTYITVSMGANVGHGSLYQCLMTIDTVGTVGWDWPRIH